MNNKLIKHKQVRASLIPYLFICCTRNILDNTLDSGVLFSLQNVRHDIYKLFIKCFYYLGKSYHQVKLANKHF